MYDLDEQLAAFYQFKILNTDKELIYDNLTRLAANISETKYAFVNFVMSDIIVNKSSYGIELGNTPKNGSFSEQVIEKDAFTEIENILKHPSLNTHPFVINEPHVRFYAGIPIKLFDKIFIGTLCVFDTEERKLNQKQIESLTLIAKQIASLIEMSLQKDTLKSLFDSFLNCSLDAMCILGKDNYNFLSFNRLFADMFLRIRGTEVREGDVMGDYLKGRNFSNFEIGYAKAMKGEIAYSERLVTFDTFSEWYLTEYNPIRNSTGQIIAVGFTVRNVSAEHKFKELLNETSSLANVGGWELNYLTKEIIWTSETKRIFDLDDEYEPNENSFFDFIDGEQHKLEIFQCFKETIKIGVPFQLELPIITANKTNKWIIFKGKSIFEGHNCVRIYGAVSDITKDKLLQLSLIENQERFRGIEENTPDIIYELNVEGNFEYVSPSVHSVLGYLPSDLIGFDFRKILHQEDVLPFEMFMAALIYKGVNEDLIEYRVVHKDGHEEWHESKCSLIKRKGRVFIIGIARNITSWKITQEKLKRLNEDLEKNTARLIESEKRYTDLFLESPQPMWLYDLETLKFLQVNKATIATYGYTEEEFKKMYVWQVRIKEQQEQSQKYHKNNFYTGNNYSVRRQHVTKSGNVIDVELFSNLVVINEKNYRLVIAVDVTGNIKYLQAIESQNKKFKEIAWIQSHLVRHPLVNIMGLLSLINRTPVEQLKNDNIISSLMSEAKKLDEIIQDIVQKAIEVERQELPGI